MIPPTVAAFGPVGVEDPDRAVAGFVGVVESECAGARAGFVGVMGWAAMFGVSDTNVLIG